MQHNAIAATFMVHRLLKVCLGGADHCKQFGRQQHDVSLWDSNTGHCIHTEDRHQDSGGADVQLQWHTYDTAGCRTVLAKFCQCRA